MDYLTITIAKHIVTSCDLSHNKVVREETKVTFSFYKNDKHKSCALCVDKIAGLTDHEICNLRAQEIAIDPKLEYASMIRNTALELV